MRYKFCYMSMTEIGQLFYKDLRSASSATSHDVGRWLQDIGLRTKDKSPSLNATESGIAIQKLTGKNKDIPNHYWEPNQTVAALEKAGHKRLPNPPENIVCHEKIEGPYVCERNHLNGYDIKSNSDTITTVYGDENAEMVLQALNAYDRCVKKKRESK